MDYENRLYNGDPVECVTFKGKGFIYGPIRLSYRPQSPIYTRLVEPASRIDFVRGRIAIFLIRDPRDILVSSYYSFGYKHRFSTVKEIEERLDSRPRLFSESDQARPHRKPRSDRSQRRGAFHQDRKLRALCHCAVFLFPEDRQMIAAKFASTFTIAICRCRASAPLAIANCSRRRRRRGPRLQPRRFYVGRWTLNVGRFASVL